MRFLHIRAVVTPDFLCANVNTVSMLINGKSVAITHHLVRILEWGFFFTVISEKPSTFQNNQEKKLQYSQFCKVTQ